MRERTPRGLDEDVMDTIFHKGLADNEQEILREWATPLTARQRRRLKSFSEQYGPVRALNIGPLTRAHLGAFAAKLACTLHYNESGAILPSSGGIVVQMHSADQLVRLGPVDSRFMALLGPSTTLRQGKDEVADQFVWRSAHDELGSIHWASLPGCMEFVLLAVNDPSILPKTGQTSQLVYRPGRFAADGPDMIGGTMRMSWVQDFE